MLDIADLPPGAMRRVTRGELDVLLAHTPEGIVAVDDRCPHMSAPLSIRFTHVLPALTLRVCIVT